MLSVCLTVFCLLDTDPLGSIVLYCIVFYYLSLDPHRITKSMDTEIISYNSNKITSSLRFYNNIIQNTR